MENSEKNSTKNSLIQILCNPNILVLLLLPLTGTSEDKITGVVEYISRNWSLILCGYFVQVDLLAW